MKMIMHYFVCACRVLKGCLLLFIKTITNYLILVFRFVKSIFLLNKKIEISLPDNTLSDYYPDNGCLCDQTGFAFKSIKYDLSIIIPMYNISAYIEECIDSILSQDTEYSFELILVDDGSTDDTYQKVIPYSNDKRVTIFHQDNNGQSAARNRAIYYSQGKYIMFVDGDDILLSGAVQLLLSTAIQTNSEIAEGNYIWFYNSILDKSSRPFPSKIRIESYNNNPKFVLSCPGYSVAKVYKRELWRTLRFPEKYIFEDMITKYILRRKANQVAFIDTNVYAYRYNSNSSTHNNNELKKLDSIWVFRKHLALCKKEHMPFDSVFYMIALGAIGLNTIVLNIEDVELKKMCFFELKENLIMIQPYRSINIPFFFKMIEKSIMTGNMVAWEYIVKTILKCDILKKYREKG